MKRKDRDTYVMSTGREIRASHGIVGIARGFGGRSDETFATFEIAGGYDSHLEAMKDGDSAGNPATRFTPAERVELADFMITQWQDLKRHAAAAIGPTRRVTSTSIDLDHGTVHLRLECGHEAQVQLADPVLAVTEAYALPKAGDDVACPECRGKVESGKWKGGV